MEIRASSRLNELGTYAFAAIDEKVAQLKRDGLEPVDFGVGDPTTPIPELIRNAMAAGIERWKSAGYPPYVGGAEFRNAVTAWSQRRFGIELDADKEVCSSIGSKEAIFNFPEAILDAGDMVIVPDPGYPPYDRGTHFAEGKSYLLPIRPENNFLPDLSEIPDEVAKRARIFWLTHPNSPAGAAAPPEYLKQWIDYCQKHDIIAASDEAYSEIYFNEPPHTALEYGRDGVVVFQSLSKRSAMTGCRIGWVAGDERIVSLFKKVKTNIDSGTPFFIQDGAVAALGDETHVEAMRDDYRAKRDLLVNAFEKAGCPRSEPEATLYIWQRSPEGMDGMDLAQKLLDPSVCAVTLPGSAICNLPESKNSGSNYIRLALVPSIEDTQRVADAISRMTL